MAAIPSIVSYFGPDKSATWNAIAAHEEKLQEILLSYLRNRADVTIHGERSADQKLRVPVVSFTVEGRSSKSIVDGIESRSNFGCRWGHFYSKRLVDDRLGLAGCDGVVRVSMVLYNTGKSPCKASLTKWMKANIQRSGRSGAVCQGPGRSAVRELN